MNNNRSSQQQTLKKLNKMLDMADKTGSTSDLANVHNYSNLTTIDDNTEASIVYTPYKQTEQVLAGISGRNYVEDAGIKGRNDVEDAVFTAHNATSPDNGSTVYTASLGKKMIQITKELPETPSSGASDLASIKPPARNRNRPSSMDASPLLSELNKQLNSHSPPPSPPRTTTIPLSPRKFDLQKEKHKTKSLEDVQTMLSEQIEELRSVVSGSEEKSNKLSFFAQPPNINQSQETGLESEASDKFFSAINSPVGSQEFYLAQDVEEKRNAENILVVRSSNLEIKKVDVSPFTENNPYNSTGAAENNAYASDDEYEDIVEYDDMVEDTDVNIREDRKKNSRNKRHLKTKNNNGKFDLKTMETLLSDLDLVGDFDNLGMKNEEKKYLQLVVKNLSKLTADMILDPSKYEEGLRRLKKAALALEGF